MTEEYDEEWQPAPSEEVILEGMRRAGRRLDDYRLDDQIAVAQARRDVAAAYRFDDLAAMWQRVVLAMDEVRRERQADRREFGDVTNPVRVVRPLTAEELAESDDD